MHMPRGKHHSDSADHLNERSTSPEICRSPRGDLISLVRVCFTGTLQAVDPPPPTPPRRVLRQRQHVFAEYSFLAGRLNSGLSNIILFVIYHIFILL